VRKGDFVALAWRADQAHRIAKRVAGGVDFGAQAAAGATKALGIRPPHMGCFQSSSIISALCILLGVLDPKREPVFAMQP
jgi:hypothetical protein